MAIDNFRKADIILDSANGYIMDEHFAKVGDISGRDLIVQISNNGVIQSQPDINLIFSWHNKNIGNSGMIEFKAGDRSQGLFKVTFPDEMNNTGRVAATIGIEKDGQYTFSRNFLINVESNAFKASAPLESDDWALLLGALNKTNHITELTEQQLKIFYEKSQGDWEKFVDATRDIISAIDPGGVLIDEIIKARKPQDQEPYASVGERMNDLYHGFNINLNLDAKMIKGIKEVAGGINTTKAVLKVGLINDLHFQKMIDPSWYGEAVLDIDHVKLFSLFSDKLNALVLNGDQVHGQEIGENSPGITEFEGDRQMLIARNSEVMSTAQYCLGEADVFANIGNHEDGSVRWDKPLTLDELKQAYRVESFDTFKDYDDQKVRVIIFNIFDNTTTDVKRATNSVINQPQLDWLADEALKVPAGYSTVIFTHAPLEGFFDNKPYSSEWTNVNHDLVKGILTAFVNGVSFSDQTKNGKISVDFTDQGKRDLVGVISGHEHRDAPAPEIHNGIRGILRTCSIGIGDGRVLGDYSELASDVIEIDVAKKNVKFKRIGYGSDLEFNY